MVCQMMVCQMIVCKMMVRQMMVCQMLVCQMIVCQMMVCQMITEVTHLTFQQPQSSPHSLSARTQPTWSLVAL